VHALGVIWFQLLTGDLTRGAGTDWLAELAEQQVPDGVVQVLGKCLASKAERRLASAVVLIEELDRLPPPVSQPPLLPDPPPERRPKAKPGNTRSQAPENTLTNSIGIKLALIPAGRFLMGSPDTEPERSADEGPQHHVIISQPFYLGVYPVTQREYEAVMGKNPAHFNSHNKGGPEHPVEQVSWDEAVEFCERLSILPQEKKAGSVYRLPTEAEWEYACRAGTTTAFWWGDSTSARKANFKGKNPYGGSAEGQYQQRTTKVGSFQANPWGLYDLHGNVWEWCSDWYTESFYRQGDNKDPQGPKSGERRVLRGGSWGYNGRYWRAASRNHYEPGVRFHFLGFRVALTLPPRIP